MRFRKLTIILGALALAAGVGVGAAVADQSAPPADCQVQAGQQGTDEEQATADDVSTAASEVEQEAGNQQADDQAGDQQDANDQSDEQGENEQCGDQGDQGDDQSGDEGGD